jgi:hypothetical protein
LRLCDAGFSRPGAISAWGELIAAFQAAAAASSPRAAAAAAVSSKAWQLQSLSLGRSDTGQLQQLPKYIPAHSFTQLACSLSRADAEQMNECLTSGISRLTALRSLEVHLPDLDAVMQPDDLLAPLSALQQLTALQLRGGLVRRAQLKHLQLPQLQRLQAEVGGGLFSRVGQLQLAHLATVTKLSQLDASGVLERAKQLPPNLQELTLRHDDDNDSD